MNKDTEEISSLLGKHYSKKFNKYGPCAQGVDWGNKEWALDLRNRKMLEVVNVPNQQFSILDVGCGYGSLASSIKEKNLGCEYSGIDIAQNMIDFAEIEHKEFNFICEDYLKWETKKKYDYLVCSGILTQKLNTSNLEMNKFASKLIKKMFNNSKKGIAFNCMSTFVNFQNENLYYRNPSELLAWIMSEISSKVKLDCSYELPYEYTIYIYR